MWSQRSSFDEQSLRRSQQRTLREIPQFAHLHDVGNSTHANAGSTFSARLGAVARAVSVRGGFGRARWLAVFPSTPAIEALPSVRRLSDAALFLALDSMTGPLSWQTLSSSAWPRLSGRDWADCTADDAATVAAATICTILPI